MEASFPHVHHLAVQGTAANRATLPAPITQHTRARTLKGENLTPESYLGMHWNQAYIASMHAELCLQSLVDRAVKMVGCRKGQ